MKKQLFTIGVGIIIIVVLITALIFIGFDISKKAIKVSESKQDIYFRSNIIKSLSILRSDINKIQPYIYGLNNVLPTKDQLINFPRELSLIASQNKINLSFNFSGENSNDRLKWIELTGTAEGDFINIINFLKSIENSNYSVKIDNIDFNEKDDVSKTIFNGKVFYF